MCAYPDKASDAGITTSSVLRIYDLEALSTDTIVRECIEKGGDWKAAPHDSQAYLEAEQAKAQRELEKMERTTGGAGP
jgi:hypothetical protein